MRSLLFFFAVIVVFVLVMFSITRLQTLRSSIKKPHQQKPSSEKPMVKCAHCGVYLPKSDAIVSRKEQIKSPQSVSEEYFCCEEHREEFIKNKPES